MPLLKSDCFFKHICSKTGTDKNCRSKRCFSDVRYLCRSALTFKYLGDDLLKTLNTEIIMYTLCLCIDEETAVENN